MPEISEDATILIATSYQALNRAGIGNEITMICDCTVVIVFAAFFIEANLNKLILDMNKIDDMKNFFGKYRPGLTDKLAWYYNIFVASSKATNREELKSLYKELESRFPGFNSISKFRNNIAHGTIDRTITNLEDAEKLRLQAKAIVNELFKLAEYANFKIPRSVTYEIAISGSNYRESSFCSKTDGTKFSRNSSS